MNNDEFAGLFKGIDLPRIETGQCPVCGDKGALESIAGYSQALRSGELSAQVDALAGEKCRSCGEIFLDQASDSRLASAVEALVQAAKDAKAARLKFLRVQLGMSQKEASRLTGGGHNAFSRYENGQATPLPAVTHLLDLLARHPELGNELPGVRVVRVPSAKRKPGMGAFHLQVPAASSRHASQGGQAVDIEKIVASRSREPKRSTNATARRASPTRPCK